MGPLQLTQVITLAQAIILCQLATIATARQRLESRQQALLRKRSNQDSWWGLLWPLVPGLKQQLEERWEGQIERCQRRLLAYVQEGLALHEYLTACEAWDIKTIYHVIMSGSLGIDASTILGSATEATDDLPMLFPESTAAGCAAVWLRQRFPLTLGLAPVPRR